jgi:CheY-like chemotaxis protein
MPISRPILPANPPTRLESRGSGATYYEDRWMTLAVTRWNGCGHANGLGVTDRGMGTRSRRRPICIYAYFINRRFHTPVILHRTELSFRGDGDRADRRCGSGNHRACPLACGGTGNMIDRPIVLIVEDERQIRRFVGTALEGEGWAVHEAATVRGLSDASTRESDLIILDLGLPDGDGMTFLRDLRGWSTVPVLVLSARVREHDKVNAPLHEDPRIAAIWLPLLNSATSALKETLGPSEKAEFQSI